MIKMNVLAANNQVAKIMLHINKLLHRATLVMIINKANRPRDLRTLFPHSSSIRACRMRLFMASDRVG